MKLPHSLRRLGYGVGGRLTPSVAGRRATNAFGTTRAFGLYPDDVPPLGARRFRIEGDADVEGGYVWGQDGASAATSTTGANGANGSNGHAVPTALLVHGWGTDSSSMHSLIPTLRDLGMRVAAFDAPAHGVNPGSQATMTQFSRSVGNVLDTLGGVDVVVAHSLGSIATISAVAKRPHLGIRALVLLAAPNTLTGVLERWAASPAERLPRRVVDLIYKDLWGRNGVPVSHWNIAELGKALDVPVLVIHDPADPLVPFDEAKIVASGLPDARLEVIDGQGHMGILAAAVVKELVQSFLRESAAGPEATPNPLQLASDVSE